MTRLGTSIANIILGIRRRCALEKVTKNMYAGFLATIPMTMVMIELFKHLPKREQYPLPPRVISMNIAKDLGVKKDMNEKEKLSFTFINHFLYGALAAVLYFPLTKKIKLNNQLSGISYGLAVWGASYLGILPALNLYPKVTKEPAKRNALMIISHIVWGSSLGVMKTLFQNKSLRLLKAF